MLNQPCFSSHRSAGLWPPPLPSRDDGSLLSQANYDRLLESAASINRSRLPQEWQYIKDPSKPDFPVYELFKSAFDPRSFIASSQKSLGEVLYLAVYVGDHGTVQKALSCDAYPDYPMPKFPDCPLNAAFAFGHEEIAKMLLDAGATLIGLAEAMGVSEQYLMGRTISSQTSSVLKTCLEHRGKAAFPPDSVLLACAQSRPGILQLLDQYDFDLELKSREGATLLHTAAQFDNADALLYLLDQGFSTESVDSLGHTTLHYAAAYTSLAAVKTLRNKAELDPVSQTGDTPMHLLMLHAVDARGKDKSAWALQPIKVAILEELHSAGAALDAVNHEGERPLHIAIRRCLYLLAARLISLGSDVETPNGKGYTPLHLCACGGEGVHARIAADLVLMGASLESRTPCPDLWTPLDIAKQARTPNLKMIDLLAGSGRKRGVT